MNTSLVELSVYVTSWGDIVFHPDGNWYFEGKQIPKDVISRALRLQIKFGRDRYEYIGEYMSRNLMSTPKNNQETK